MMRETGNRHNIKYKQIKNGEIYISSGFIQLKVEE